jgi:Protein of unknown function (DUF3137)
VSEVGPFLVVSVAAVVAATVGVYRWWRDQKRATELRQFCLSTGWRYVVRDDSWAVRWTATPFFEGRQRQARNVISGTLGQTPASYPFVAFDYSYVTDHGDGQGHRVSTTHRFVICAVLLPTYLPALQVTPETMLTRVGAGLGGDDIELESEDFNRRFRVQCPDPKFASDVLTPRTMQALLARPAVHFRFEGKDVLCWENGTLSPAGLLERTSTLAAVSAGIPSFVWHDYGVEPSPGGVAQ